MNGNGFSYHPPTGSGPSSSSRPASSAALTAAALGATIWLLHRRASWTAWRPSAGSPVRLARVAVRMPGSDVGEHAV